MITTSFLREHAVDARLILSLKLLLNRRWKGFWNVGGFWNLRGRIYLTLRVEEITKEKYRQLTM